MTMDELKEQHPELVMQIISEANAKAKEQAIADERARLQAIDEIAATIGDTELITAAKYGDEACTASEFAFQVMQKQATLSRLTR